MYQSHQKSFDLTKRCNQKPLQFQVFSNKKFTPPPIKALPPINIYLPPYAQALAVKARVKILWGGRGGAKTFTLVRKMVLYALYPEMYQLEKGMQFLVLRDFAKQNKQSVYYFLVQFIRSDESLSQFFDIYSEHIFCKLSGINIIFTGFRVDIDKVRGIGNVGIAWIEEGVNFTHYEWNSFKPSIRAANSKIISEIWITFNPFNKYDFLYQYFVVNPPPEDAIVLKVNYYDNPNFPDALELDRRIDEKRDPHEYRYKWLGEPLENAQAHVFAAKWSLYNHEDPEGGEVVYGLDWGFSDPMAAVRCVIKDNDLFITHEFKRRSVDITYVGGLLSEHIGLRKGWDQIICDSALPGNISNLCGQGYNAIPCTKRSGSVMDGIHHIRSYNKIYIHERCEQAKKEISSYSYEVHEGTGIIMNKLAKNQDDHIIDAIRYALDKHIGIHAYNTVYESINTYRKANYF